jgi:thioredoxin 1
VLEVAYDTQKDAMRALNAPSRSTLIVFKGGKEIDRSTADTDATSIEALLDKGI